MIHVVDWLTGSAGLVATLVGISAVRRILRGPVQLARLRQVSETGPTCVPDLAELDGLLAKGEALHEADRYLEPRKLRAGTDWVGTISKTSLFDSPDILTPTRRISKAAVLGPRDWQHRRRLPIGGSEGKIAFARLEGKVNEMEKRIRQLENSKSHYDLARDASEKPESEEQSKKGKLTPEMVH